MNLLATHKQTEKLMRIVKESRLVVQLTKNRKSKEKYKSIKLKTLVFLFDTFRDCLEMLTLSQCLHFNQKKEQQNKEGVIAECLLPFVMEIFMLFMTQIRKERPAEVTVRESLRNVIKQFNCNWMIVCIHINPFYVYPCDVRTFPVCAITKTNGL